MSEKNKKARNEQRKGLPLKAALAVGAGAAAAGLLLFWQRQPILRAVSTDMDAQRAPDAPAAPGRLVELERALKNPNVSAMLATIRHAEGTSGQSGYRMLFGGGLFEDLADHPRQWVTRLSRGRPLTSTAAGAYQILARTWDSLRSLGLRDFGARSQDIAAVELIRRRGALPAVERGAFAQAVELIRREWASLPGAGYGQPEKSAAELLAVYRSNGGMTR